MRFSDTGYAVLPFKTYSRVGLSHATLIAELLTVHRTEFAVATKLTGKFSLAGVKEAIGAVRVTTGVKPYTSWHKESPGTVPVAVGFVDGEPT